MSEKPKYTRDNTVIFFDVDGTITKARNKIAPEMLKTLKELRKKVNICFVGGSDLKKQKEQVGDNVLDLFDYGFPQNGVKSYKDGKPLESESFLKKMGEEKIKKLINWLLVYMSKIDLPKKRGTFIEFRECMLNVCPIGRNCTQEERMEFNELDNKRGIRKKLCEDLEKEFSDYNLAFVIGGQISIDVFPKGWDKTYCLKFFKGDNKWKHKFFFGDRTWKGGNDYEIYSDPWLKGIRVDDEKQTLKKIKEMFF